MEKLILGISCLCFCIVDVLGLPNYMKYWFNIEVGKPFNCSLCLSFWVSLITFTYRGEGMYSFLYAAMSATLTLYILKYAK